MELDGRAGSLAPLGALLTRLGAGVALCATVAAQLAADGARRPVEHPGHLSDAELLLDQTGQRHALFRLKLLVVSWGALHLRTLQGCRCCTSLLNPPSHDEDDHGWQFLDNESEELDDLCIVGLGHILEVDPSMAGLASLEPGWQATRADINSEWVIERTPPEEDGDAT